jgi:hypothetical protein
MFTDDHRAALMEAANKIKAVADDIDHTPTLSALCQALQGIRLAAQYDAFRHQTEAEHDLPPQKARTFNVVSADGTVQGVISG